MIDISILEQYFPTVNKPIRHNNFLFTITIQQEEEQFALNLKIKQQDTKEEHLIKFRLGIGRDAPRMPASHETDKPHFEIDLYKREKEAFFSTVYFTFQQPSDEQVMRYAKGTVPIISKILQNFLNKRELPESLINHLVFVEAVTKELQVFEQDLIDSLYACYEHHDLIVRQPGTEPVIIKTPHNLKKYLGHDDLLPLYQPLINRIKQR